MIARTIAAAILVMSGVARGDAELVGTARFLHSTLPAPATGTVQLTITGTGGIHDKCPDAEAGRFTATYHGTLTVETDGHFAAPLVPDGVITPSRCEVTDLRNPVIHGISIVATMDPGPVTCAAVTADPRCEGQDEDLVAIGSLNFQTLTAADGETIIEGNFDDLHATLVFYSRNPNPNRFFIQED